jgi:SAM-dependent methyltransferase
MTPVVISGTEGYAEEADFLVAQYESISFEVVRKDVLPLLPPAPARVLDIGAGTGRDAAGFASLGHRVLAVEPTAALRTRAMALHPSESIEWLDDSLPELAHVLARNETFDVVMLSAVWMHLDETQRARAMPNVAKQVCPGGMMSLSLRYGPVPKGRRMFSVSADETTCLAEQSGLRLVAMHESRDGVLKRPGVSWIRLSYSRPRPVEGC